LIGARSLVEELVTCKNRNFWNIITP